MELVEQESWNDCAPACLAMVTGHSLDTVKAAVGVPTSHAEIHGFLLRHVDDAHVLCILETLPVAELRRTDDVFQTDHEFDDRTLILTVASPNPEVEWHAVVVHEGVLYDPHSYWNTLADIDDVHCTWGFDVTEATGAPRDYL